MKATSMGGALRCFDGDRNELRCVSALDPTSPHRVLSGSMSLRMLSYDGGLAHMFLLLACARRSTGACPANLDLWECQPAARINSTLYSFSTDPWLNV